MISTDFINHARNIQLTMMKKWILIFSLSLFCAHAKAQEGASVTFTNPLLPSGADPFSFYKDGYYYYTHTTGSRIVLWKTKNIANLKSAEQKTIFTPPQGTARPGLWKASLTKSSKVYMEKRRHTLFW
jgi:hypothetical protein